MSDEIWLEKYRPVTLEEVHGNPEAVNHIREFARKGNIPNVILAGPPGIGKTSSILCLARHLLKDSYS
jgi:replication factor C subunit 2/4